MAKQNSLVTLEEFFFFNFLFYFTAHLRNAFKKRLYKFIKVHKQSAENYI